MKYTPTIGLEIHAELRTQRKMFCDCRNDETTLTPNTNVCPVCLAHPGTLPVPNQKAIESVIQTGHALHCAINKESKFDRKNYFYPDLPKAYQISQYDKPFCIDGHLTLPESGKIIRIKRIHLEEDTARLAHGVDGKYSLVDFNRAGAPLMELVTEADFHSAEDVVAFGQEFQLILRYLGVCDGDMEKGHLRLEANISIMPEGSATLGTKVEVKNLNSFRAVRGAIEYEIERHTMLWEEGKQSEIVQETRGWNEETKSTYSQRSKEDAHDYRYFPEPDIPPFYFTDEYIEQLKASIAELPTDRRERFATEYNLSASQVETLVATRELGDFFEAAVSELRSRVSGAPVDGLYNYLTSDLVGLAGELGISIERWSITPAHLAIVMKYVQENKISSRVAKDVLRESFTTGKSPEEIIQEKNLFQVSDITQLEKIVDEIITQHPTVVEEYKKGKTTVVQFLVGKAMAQTKGAANPGIIRELFEKKLTE